MTDISADRDSIYVLYTLNSGLLITISDQEREQGRLRGSRGEQEVAPREQGEH